jgi:PAS domain S-box-containing protein
MSLPEKPQPVQPVVGAPYPHEQSTALAGTPSPQNKPDKTLQQTGQDLRQTGQDEREIGQNSREAKQDSRQSNQNNRETRQDTRQTGQDEREIGQNSREARQNSRQSKQNSRETSQDTRETGQNTRETSEDYQESGQAIADIETRYQLLVNSVTDYALYMLDPEGRVVTWNVGAERSKGYSAKEILGQNYTLFFLPEDIRAGVPEQELAAAARDGHYQIEAWRRRKDGSKFWALITLTAIRGSDGDLFGFAKVTRDMTERKAAEEALHSRNAELDRYRIIVENVADYVIFTLDTEGRINSWSLGARNVTGYPAQLALGRDYSFVFTPEEIQTGVPQREIAEAARNGRCATENWRTRLDGSPIWSVGVLTAIRDESGSVLGYVRVGRDMTAQKRLEESLEKMAADLELRVADRTRELEATVAELRRKNQEVESFVYIVSHDLRAPLVNVQGFARELDESCKHLRETILACPGWGCSWPKVQAILDDEIAEALHYISTSATKFERLIDALLGLSRQGRQVYQLKRIDVWELVSNALANFQQAIEAARAEIEMRELPAATADATALGQVFSNLIGNCLKYRSPERKLKIEIGGQAEGEMLHYWVRDNGLGIPETGKARLFQVFQRLHPKQAEGEGMGLAIAHRIVERHGGMIWAENNPELGSTFHFSLSANPVSTLKASGMKEVL